MTTTPLSYSLPAFQPGGYSAHRQWIDDLHTLGFRWITLTPTYLVYDEIPPRIDYQRGPAIDELQAVAAYAHSRGMRVKLEPHLDFETTLTGGPYEWRRRMYFSPIEYGERLLQPLGAIAREYDGLLTLGSELDVTIAEFAGDWLAVRRTLHNTRVGHKLNHDSLSAGNKSIRQACNAERARRGRKPVGWLEGRLHARSLRRYLQSLDYVSFSFYPSVAGADDLAAAFTNRARQLRREMGDLRAEFGIGEFGLGCCNLDRPFDFDAGDFLDPEGQMRPEAQQLRRRYYAAFLDALRQHPEVFGAHPATFWTVTHFDFLGSLRQSGYATFQDDLLRAKIREYNQVGGNVTPPQSIKS